MPGEAQQREKRPSCPGDMGHGEAEYGELRPLAGARPGGKELRSQRTRGDK